MYDSAQADNALKAAFSKLWSQVHGESRGLLLKAEQARVKNRDAQCAYEADGSPHNTAFDASVMACVAEANRARAKYLEDDLKRW
ncbi:lysozyme inhibitor LprI family protein [Sphingomonas yunnanensis]|nr:lysozyme inhibitor LprI family protein [Sphingomonas yunnanensis]MBY9061896.1 lysozyme inhibitor LprI family protein [Sphingomonas yunnanensis]